VNATSRLPSPTTPSWGPIAAAVGASLALFSVLAGLVSAGEGFGWDGSILDGVNALAPVSSEDVHIDPVLHGSTIAVAVATALYAGLLVVRSHLRAALFLLGSIIGAVALSALVKVLVKRPPIEGAADDYTFPSGSATWSMATLVALVLLAPSARARWLTLLVGAVFVVGYAGVVVFEEWHYASDILAAWCLGLAWAGALWLAVRRPRPEAPAS
jgi:undecaprenyl-diphosphatase